MWVCGIDDMAWPVGINFKHSDNKFLHLTNENCMGARREIFFYKGTYFKSICLGAHVCKYLLRVLHPHGFVLAFISCILSDDQGFRSEPIKSSVRAFTYTVNA
jgi:hypothetical protein